MPFPIYERHEQRQYPNPKDMVVNWAGFGEKISQGIGDAVQIWQKQQQLNAEKLKTEAYLKNADLERQIKTAQMNREFSDKADKLFEAQQDIAISQADMLSQETTKRKEAIKITADKKSDIDQYNTDLTDALSDYTLSAGFDGQAQAANRVVSLNKDLEKKLGMSASSLRALLPDGNPAKPILSRPDSDPVLLYHNAMNNPENKIAIQVPRTTDLNYIQNAANTPGTDAALIQYLKSRQTGQKQSSEKVDTTEVFVSPKVAFNYWGQGHDKASRDGYLSNMDPDTAKNFTKTLKMDKMYDSFLSDQAAAQAKATEATQVAADKAAKSLLNAPNVNIKDVVGGVEVTRPNPAATSLTTRFYSHEKFADIVQGAPAAPGSVVNAFSATRSAEAVKQNIDYFTKHFDRLNASASNSIVDAQTRNRVAGELVSLYGNLSVTPPERIAEAASAGMSVTPPAESTNALASAAVTTPATTGFTPRTYTKIDPADGQPAYKTVTTADQAAQLEKYKWQLLK